MLVLLAIALSGCNERKPVLSSNGNNSDDEVELVDYNVLTRNEPNNGIEYKKIRFTIKNAAEKMLDIVFIKVRFYDSNNILLKTEIAQISNFASRDTSDFSVIYSSSESYYGDVDWDNIQFEFLVS